MEQTKIVSLIEVVTNVITGFLLAMAIWEWVIPVLFPRMAGPVAENFVVTATFTFFSILRAYGWRRFFARGFHAVLVDWVGKLWLKDARNDDGVKLCEEIHLAAALGDRPCTVCGEDSWCSKHR